MLRTNSQPASGDCLCLYFKKTCLKQNLWSTRENANTVCLLNKYQDITMVQERKPDIDQHMDPAISLWLINFSLAPASMPTFTGSGDASLKHMGVKSTSRKH